MQLLAIPPQGIHCTRLVGPLGDGIAQCKGLLLEGHRDIGAQPANLTEGLHSTGEIIQRRFTLFILHSVATLSGKRVVNIRRAGMTHRIAKNTIQPGF